MVRAPRTRSGCVRRVLACSPGDATSRLQSRTSDEGGPAAGDGPSRVSRGRAKGDYKHLSIADQHRAHVAYLKLKGPGVRAPYGAVKALCDEWGKGHGFFTKLVEKFATDPTLAPKPHVRRPHKMTDEVHDMLVEVARKRDWDVTYSELVFGLSEEYGVDLSKWSVWKHITQSGFWNVHKMRTKPTLSPIQMEARLAFAREHVNNTWENWVDIDEKWFFVKTQKGTVKVPVSEQTPHQHEVLPQHECSG